MKKDKKTKTEKIKLKNFHCSLSDSYMKSEQGLLDKSCEKGEDLFELEFSFGEKSSPGKFTGKRFSQVCMGKQLCWIKGVSEPGKYTDLKLLINTAPSHAANSAGLPIESDDVTFASSSTFVSRLSCG